MVGAVADETEAVSPSVSVFGRSDNAETEFLCVCVRHRLQNQIAVPLTQLRAATMRLCSLDWADLCAGLADARIVADRNATARAKITMTATITLVCRFLDIMASSHGAYQRAKRS